MVLVGLGKLAKIQSPHRESNPRPSSLWQKINMLYAFESVIMNKVYEGVATLLWKELIIEHTECMSATVFALTQDSY